MPVTAKLSQRVYEQLGDDVANAIVDWFNAVDETYKADLRELNDLNFARFDAKMGERFAQADAKTERRFAEFDAKMEHRFAEVDGKWEGQFSALRNQFSELREEMRVGFAKVDAKIEALGANQLRWSVALWIATIGALAAILRLPK